MFKLLAAAGAALVLGMGAAQAAGPVDPDWPCIQRRVPQLSLGQVWAGPIPDEAIQAKSRTPEIQALAARISQRRTTLPEAETLIADFAKASPEDVTALYLAIFDKINAARSRVLAGIARYAHKQAALDKEIAGYRADFDRLSAAEPPDFDAVDQAEKKIDWATRVFLDRQQSLTYVCETPGLLEQRAIARGRAAQGNLP